MKRLVPVLALLLVAATAEETRQFRVAQATFEDKLYDVAERQLAEFLEKFPQSDRAENAHLLLAQAQLNVGKWEPAVKVLQDSLARWPDKRPDTIYFWLGEALARGGKFAEAAARYTDVVDKFPRSLLVPPALYGLAFVELRQNRFNAARETLDRLAKVAPKGDLAVEAELLRGQIYLGTEKFDKAEAVFKSVIDKAPETRAAYRAQLWFGRSLAQHQQYDEARKHHAVVTDAFKAKPNRPVDAQLAAEAWYAAAWADWQQEKFDSAAESFTAALANAQSPQLKRDALLKLAEAIARAGHVADGVARLREFLQAHPTDPLADQVQLAIGQLLLGDKDFAAALPEFTQLLAKYPNSLSLARANLKAGWCAWELRRPAEAQKYFQRAFDLTKDAGEAAEALFKVGDAQFALGQYTEAVGTYQRLISDYPAATTLDGAMFQLGEAYRQLRNPEGALATFESLVKQFPKSGFAPEAQYTLGQILVGRGQEAEARAAFAAVVTHYPESEWARNAALAGGESYTREGKYDQAIAEFDKLMANGLDNELAQQAFYNRGWCHASMGRREKTLADFTEFLKKYPAAPLAPDIQYWIADEYLRQKDYLKAQAQFQSLAETYPASKLADAAQYFAGRAAYARQDYKPAIELYEGVLKKFPESGWRCDARFGEGDALSELGQFDDALLIFDSLLKTFPDCGLVCEAQGRRGDCQYSLTRYDDAIASYQKALDCAKDTTMRSQALFKMGQCYEKLGKLDDALSYYTKPIYESTVAPDPNEPPERFWSCKAGRAAAGIKEQQQQWREAITLYDKLGKNCPDLQPMVEDLIRKIRVQHFIPF